MQLLRHFAYLLAAGFCLATSSFAAVVPDLYTAQVAVEDRGTEALAKGAQAALAQVLVKVSGSDGVLQSNAVNQAMRSARARVQTYSYVDAVAGDQPQVRIEFDADYVTQLVRQAGAPLWTANRPAVLGWVVVQEDNRRRFLNADTDPVLAEQVVAAFSRRGLVLQLPLHDLKDAAALRASDAWNRNSTLIKAASERYSVDNVVIARVSPQPDDRYRVDWRYYFGEETLASSGQVGTVASAFQPGADLVADSMASRYAVAPSSGEPQTVHMLVSGVFEYADYAGIIRWVRSLEPIAAADIDRVQGDRLTLRLSTRAQPQSLRNIIELNEKLIPAQGLDSTVALSYRWRN